MNVQNLRHPDSVAINDHIFYTEDVFFKREKKHVFYGKRSVIVVVTGAGVPGNYVVKILKCKGENPFPEGVQIEKPASNLLRGFLIDNLKDLHEFRSGGYLQGTDPASGKTVKLDTADKGGMSVGATHATGGIKGDVAGRAIEFENKEAVIVAEVNQDQTQDEFEGKKMNAREILSYINKDNGGKDFEAGGETGTDGKPVGFKGGEIILTAPVTPNTKTYNYNGKQMTGLQVASAINVRNNGVAFAD